MKAANYVVEETTIGFYDVYLCKDGLGLKSNGESSILNLHQSRSVKI